MSDWEYSDESCPKCGQQMATRSCDVIGCDDGYIDEYDDDPINFAEGESYERCSECRGTGIHEWCRECGWDNILKHFMSDEYEQAWLAKQETTNAETIRQS